MHAWLSQPGTSFGVLLGAGASVPAGLPTANGLIKMILQSRKDPDCSWERCWYHLVQELDLSSVGVEYAYQMIDTLLQLRRNSSLQKLVSLPSDIAERDLIRILEYLEQRAAEILRSTSRSARDLSYLHPLLEANPAFIATLNFDGLIERAGADQEICVDTGADRWDGSNEWPELDQGIPLLKLHGSLNWESAPVKVGPIPVMGMKTLSPTEEQRFGGAGLFSHLRFGNKNKLTSAGFMPAIMRAFIDRLEQVDTLVVIGYSFQDTHVNAYLNRWAALNDRARIIVIDYGLTPEKEVEGLYDQMVDGLNRESSLRIEFVNGDAEDKIATVFA